MMLAAAVVGLGLVFNGGDLADFVQQYAAESHRGVVIAAERPAPPLQVAVRYDWNLADAQHTAEYVGARLNAVPLVVESANVKGWCYQVFRPRELPMWLAPGWSDASFEAYDKAFPQDNRGLDRDGPLVIPKCETGKYRLGEFLEHSHFSKPVKVHWLLQHCHYAAAGIFCSEEDYLRCVAKAIGGKLTVSPSSYTVELDPAAYRRQLQEYLQARRGGLFADDYFGRAYADLRIAALDVFSDSQIASAMGAEHSYANSQVGRGSTLGRQADAVVEAFLYRGTDPGSRDRKVLPGSKELLDSADPGRPPILSLSAHDGVCLLLPTHDGEGAVQL